MTQRPHIIFVDDEPRILSGLRRMLRTYRDRWDMSFVEGGALALETMRTRHCDVIVTDYRMPGMDGAALLSRVRADFPGTARVILSGQTDESKLLDSMMLTHGFLTKPATPEQLVATVERLIGANSKPVEESVRRDVTFVESLPSMPTTLVELLAALDAHDVDAASVGAVIERDPAATAKVLQLVNSSAYALGSKVGSVSQAVAMLGLHTVRGLVIMHDLVRTFDTAGKLPLDWMDALTLHSVESSRLARQLAAGRQYENHAFTAGLLHEVGQLVLAMSRPVEFAEALHGWRQSGSPGCDLRTVELAAFNTCHNDVGAHLLHLWGLPDPVIDAVAHHSDPEPVTSVVDASSAVALAHASVEADCGVVCGPYTDAAELQHDALDPAAREAVSRWQRARSRQG